MDSENSLKQLLLDLSSNMEIRANFLKDPVNVFHKYGINMGTKTELEMAIFIEMTVQNLENLYTRMEQLPESPDDLKKYYNEIKHTSPPDQRMFT